MGTSEPGGKTSGEETFVLLIRVLIWQFSAGRLAGRLISPSEVVKSHYPLGVLFAARLTRHSQRFAGFEDRLEVLANPAGRSGSSNLSIL